MKKHKENLFAEKFHLLNSQESQDITWSSSESSDFENISSNVDKLCNITNKKNRKRKRKEKVPKNISNLDVTIVDVHKDAKNASLKVETELPIAKSEVECSSPKSPILGSTQYFSPYQCKNISTSPIITSKSIENRCKIITSPILVLKSASPKISPNVRKKLFKSDKILNVKEEVGASRSKPVISNDTYCLDRRKANNKTQKQKVNQSSDQHKNILTNENQNSAEVNDKKITLIKHELSSQESKISVNIDEIEIPETQKNDHVIKETPEVVNLDDSVSMLKTSSIDLVKRVKSYFDCHFSSENASQNTISEISTPKNNSKSSDDIEIICSITQVVSNRNSAESIKQEIDDNNKKEKKIRYKKDGLAYRLNSLVKKQTASISLWHHEKFLAANSNFFIPKGEFLAFRICKVHFKYGCYLLEAMDIYDENFLILINNCLMTTDIFTSDSIVKLYEPYKILDLNHNCKYVINVIKFECVNIKK